MVVDLLNRINYKKVIKQAEYHRCEKRFVFSSLEEGYQEVMFHLTENVSIVIAI